MVVPMPEMDTSAPAPSAPSVGQFGPGMTMAEFAKMLAVAMNLPPVPSYEHPDILPADARYLPESGYIAALMEAGIMKGISADSFAPDRRVTRDIASVVFTRALGLPETYAGGYIDVRPEENWAAGAIGAMWSAGYMKGVGGGYFNPQAGFTADQFNTVWGRVLDDPTASVVAGEIGTPTEGGTDDEALTEDAIQWGVDQLVRMFDLQDYDENELRDFVVKATEGDWPPERQWMEFESTHAFDTRFGTAYSTWEERTGGGERRPSPQEILDFEVSARAAMRFAGMPEQFYDHYTDLQEIYGRGVDLQELEQRIDMAWTAVYTAPAEVRQWYAAKFGMEGDAALAASVLDPDMTEPILLEMYEKAAVGGAGAYQGFSITEQLAGRLADVGVNFEKGLQGFGNLAVLAPLFQETHGELEDYDELQEGVNAEFIGGEHSRLLESRRQARLAAFSGGGGAATGRQGVIGLGSAE